MSKKFKVGDKVIIDVNEYSFNYDSLLDYNGDEASIVRIDISDVPYLIELSTSEGLRTVWTDERSLKLAENTSLDIDANNIIAEDFKNRVDKEVQEYLENKEVITNLGGANFLDSIAFLKRYDAKQLFIYNTDDKISIGIKDIIHGSYTDLTITFECLEDLRDNIDSIIKEHYIKLSSS